MVYFFTASERLPSEFRGCFQAVRIWDMLGQMLSKSKFFRAANYAMTLAFLFSAAVQYNDPDPLQWTAVYGAAAILCILSLRGGLSWKAPAALALIALVWAATLAPRVIGEGSLVEMFESVGMKTIAIEEGREMLGLLIVAAWMTLLAFACRRLAKVPPPSTP